LKLDNLALVKAHHLIRTSTDRQNPSFNLAKNFYKKFSSGDFHWSLNKLAAAKLAH